jgi:hypothetical protein
VLRFSLTFPRREAHQRMSENSRDEEKWRWNKRMSREGKRKMVNKEEAQWQRRRKRQSSLRVMTCQDQSERMVQVIN